MLHLKDLTISPPGGWKFTDPNSGFILTAITFNDIVRNVEIHRRNNSYPSLTTAEIENAICLSLSPASQAEFCAEGARIPPFIPWTDVASFLKTAGVWLLSGLKTVPQDEAERRAAICAGCPYNRGLVGGCPACTNAVNSLRSEILQKTTSLDGKLQACAICHCDNRTTVHIPLKTLETVPHDFSLAKQWCWREPTGPNYKS